jgi:hypothetical protein
MRASDYASSPPRGSQGVLLSLTMRPPGAILEAAGALAFTRI